MFSSSFSVFYRQQFGKTVQKLFEIRVIFLAIFSQFSRKSAVSRRKRLFFVENWRISGTIREYISSYPKNLKTVCRQARGFESHTLRQKLPNEIHSGVFHMVHYSIIAVVNS